MITPLVDILVPCAGSARYLEQTLTSILDQTYTHFRVQVFDNGCSHTRCNEIVAKFDDDRITCLRLERLPAIPNWNRCLRHVEADFFAFVHDDDLWPINYLERAVCALVAKPEAVCTLSAHYPFSDAPPGVINAAEQNWWQLLASLNQEDLGFAAATSPIAHMSACLFRSLRLSFDVSLRWNADQNFLFSYLLVGECLVLENSCVRIRQHGENDSKNFATAFASIATLDLMRRSLSQLYAADRLPTDFVQRHLAKCSPGMIFRILQVAYSWPPHIGLRKLGYTLVHSVPASRKAAEYSAIAHWLNLWPELLWPLASLGMDVRYYRQVSQGGRI